MAADGTVTLRRLWEQTAPMVGRPQARWLCEEAAACFGGEFAVALDQPVTERVVAHLDALLARLRAGEPLQYVLGHWSFRRLDLLVDRRVLIPRPETELVAGVAIEVLRELLHDFGERPLVAADLGTGSGAIGLSLAAELPRAAVEVWLTDVSAGALDVARANTTGLGMAGASVRSALGTWFDALPGALRGGLALVVSNPPYIAHDDERVEPAVREWEPAGALFAAGGGLADLHTIAVGAVTWLRPGGALVLEIGAGQGPAVMDLLVAAGLAAVEVRADLAGHDRIAIGRRP